MVQHLVNIAMKKLGTSHKQFKKRSDLFQTEEGGCSNNILHVLVNVQCRPLCEVIVNSKIFYSM